MKQALLSLMAIALLTPHVEGASSKQSSDLSVVTASGSETELTESKDLTVKFWLQQLVLSALYRNVVQDSSVEEWERQVNAVPRISCGYPANTKIAIPERQMLTFEHLLVPLTGGDYPAYMNRAGFSGDSFVLATVSRLELHVSESTPPRTQWEERRRWGRRGADC